MTRVTQEHVDARRGAILNAAARLFAQRGVSGATMADIATEAGLSAGAIYRYFKNKEELSHAVFDEAQEQNARLFHETAEQATSPLQALELVGRKVWIEHNELDDLICDVQMALYAARDPQNLGVDFTHMRMQLRSLLKEMILQAQGAGELDASLDADHLAVILQACTAGIQMMKLAPDDDFDVEGAFDLFVQMVRCLGAPVSTEQGS